MATKILFIRHGEKPDDSVRGVSEAGGNDPNELAVRGWQRAGALVRFFDPPNGKFSHPALATPDVIYACAPTDHCQSVRSEHIVLLLAQHLNKKLNLRYAKKQEQAVAKDAVAAKGVVLIAWEHDAIPDIANAIVGNDSTCPQKWHDSRFDLVWVLDPQPHSGWKFTEVAQMLLPGDLAQPVAAPARTGAATAGGSHAEAAKRSHSG